MADIATLWHWQPDYMESLEVDDLMQWHQRAIIRNEYNDEQTT